jgi:tRNA 2-thiocytidine biosynthesis protein TtcA
MPPKLLSDDAKHIVIRPLALCAEADINAYAQQRRFPLIPCNLCGSQQQLQRQTIKHMLAQWERDSPGRTDMIMRSLRHAVPSHLADTRLYDFVNLTAVRDSAFAVPK